MTMANAVVDPPSRPSLSSTSELYERRTRPRTTGCMERTIYGGTLDCTTSLRSLASMFPPSLWRFGGPYVPSTVNRTVVHTSTPLQIALSMCLGDLANHHLSLVRQATEADFMNNCCPLSLLATDTASHWRVAVPYNSVDSSYHVIARRRFTTYAPERDVGPAHRMFDRLDFLNDISQVPAPRNVERPYEASLAGLFRTQSSAVEVLASRR